MVSHLVRHHIGLGKITGRLVFTFHLAVKSQIDIDFLISRTIKRPHRSLRSTACRLHHASEHHQFRLGIAHASFSEHLFPGIFRIRKNGLHHACQLLLLRCRLVIRLFDPGFTTKGVGVGLGLGLAISHTIVSDHGGRIMVDSQPGMGSVFTVELPGVSGEN